MNNKRRLTIIASLAALLLLTVLALLFNHRGPSLLKPTGSRTLYSSQIIGRNIQFPNLIDNNTLEFFTGSSFATINLRNSSTQAFTPEFNLPRVISVVWSNQKVLFEVGPISTVDELYAQADQSAQQGANSWWLWSPGLNQPKQITTGGGGDVSQAVWSSDGQTIIALMQFGSNEKQAIEYINPSTFAVVSRFAVSNTGLIGDTKQGILVRQADSLLLWKDGKSVVLPVSAATTRQPVITYDRNAVVYENDTTTPTPNTNTPARADLYVYDLKLRKSYQLLTAEQNTNNYEPFQTGLMTLPAPVNDQAPALPIDITPRLITGSGSKYTAYSLGVAVQDLQYIGQLRSLWDISGGAATTFAATNSGDDLVIVSTNPSVRDKSSPYKIVFMNEPVTLPTANGPVYLTYNVATNGLSVFFSTPTTDPRADRAAVLNNLKNYQRDPNQVQKSWISNNDVGRYGD